VLTCTSDSCCYRITMTTTTTDNAISLSVLIETTVVGGVTATATTTAAALCNKKIEAAATTRQQPQSHPHHPKVPCARCNTATIIPNVNCATTVTCPDLVVAPLVRIFRKAPGQSENAGCSRRGPPPPTPNNNKQLLLYTQSCSKSFGPSQSTYVWSFCLLPSCHMILTFRPLLPHDSHQPCVATTQLCKEIYDMGTFLFFCVRIKVDDHAQYHFSVFKAHTGLGNHWPSFLYQQVKRTKSRTSGAVHYEYVLYVSIHSSPAVDDRGNVTLSY
jgi:hypothetical protein